MVDDEKPKAIKVPDLGELDKPKGKKSPIIDDTDEPEKKDFSKIRDEIKKSLKGKKEGEKHQLLSTGAIPVNKPAKAKETEISSPEDHVPTGIPGLDKVMGGGFEKGSVTIIGGGAGSGKSILCMQFLINGILKYKETGIYITFEESRDKIIKHMSGFGWPIKQLIKDQKLEIIEYSPGQVAKLLSEGGGAIDAAIEKLKAKRLVIDSLTAFTLLHKDDLSKIESSLNLFSMMRQWECTALLIAESDPDPESHKSTVMEFEVDGVILLYNIRKGDVRERALEILKLRGIHHSTKIFPIKVLDTGIEVYPEEAFF